MLHIAQFIAALACALFTGAAIYITLVEHPARMGCATEIAATVWAPSYKRATIMQASLAIISTIAGISGWLLGGGLRQLIGAICIFPVVPFTLIIIMPTNRRLSEPDLDPASVETRRLLERWGNLHTVRSLLSTIALIIFLGSLVWQ